MSGFTRSKVRSSRAGTRFVQRSALRNCNLVGRRRLPEIFQRFASQLIAKARDRLNPDIRRNLDPEDVVQSAYRTFFRRLDEGQFELANWDCLWGLFVDHHNPQMRAKGKNTFTRSGAT